MTTTMTSKAKCESCGMPIESGPYCSYCVDDSGKLQPFDERFERMVQWALRHEPGLDRAAAEKKTLQYMGTMPAWKEHARVRGRA
jgi:hypothetical protein